ncbi:hypothetical protein GCM10011578_096700 [Streptomyces fuscichromogenes]|uniref:Secreted protein n=1 Tax=Streptomyces fuscichromogenes TaxID=1324013 RepID=A0A917XQ69_9ACTN|nr:hypothetical protein GCM10011578_096700 [Streptomyces fuscichromogenes]
MVALCLASAACSHSAAPSSAGPAPRALTAVETTLLYDAEQRLVQRCMAAQGFRVWPVARHPVPDDRSFPYAVDDVAWARRHGYGSDIREAVERVRTTDPNRRYLAGLSARRRAAALTALDGPDREGPKVTLPSGAVTGRSSRGCTSAAENRLYGDLDDWFRAENVTDDLTAVRVQRVLSDPAYRTAVPRWAACMHRRGHPYATPAAGRAAFTEAAAAGTREEEKATAVAEARCATATGLSATAHRLDGHYGAVLRRQYHAVFEDRLRMEHEALPRARSLLRTTPSPTE